MINKRLTDEEREWVINSIDTLTTNEMAKELGISRQSIHKLLRKRGLVNTSKWMKKERISYIAKNKGKKTQKQIAEHFGVRTDCVGELMRRYKREGKLK